MLNLATLFGASHFINAADQLLADAGEPHETLTHKVRGPYLEKWLLERAGDDARYLHRFLRSDADTWHDHPWDNISVVLSGKYIEDTPQGQTLLVPGSVHFRRADAPHRVILIDEQPAVTLFWHGPKIRNWNFILPDGSAVPWQEFTEDAYRI